jgi:hypothetical protein
MVAPLAPLVELVAPELVSWATSALRGAIVDAISGILPSATAAQAQPWLRIGVDYVLKQATGKAAKQWATDDPSLLAASLRAVAHQHETSLEEAINEVSHSADFVLALMQDADRIRELLRPTALEMIREIIQEQIPDEIDIITWARPLAAKYKMSVSAVIAMRSDAKRDG